MTSTDFIVPHCHAEHSVLFSDEHLLLINKPSGLLSVPGRHPLNKDCLITRLQQYWPQALIVHRLDMDTSGIMVIALSAHIHRELSQQFQHREVGKRYEAIVFGKMKDTYGQIDLPLITDWPNRPRQKVCHQQGKAALTHYQCLTATNTGSLVSLTPETGRSHQLRVHLSNIGHPIIGDNLYAHSEAKQLGSRLMLHACELHIKHPVSGDPLTGRCASNFSLDYINGTLRAGVDSAT